MHILLALALLVQPNANVGQSIQWDHDGVNTAYYSYYFDAPPYVNNLMIKQVVIPALDIGLHTIHVQACDANNNCSSDATLQFQIIAVLPTVPSNLRIIIPTTPTTPKSPTRIK